MSGQVQRTCTKTRYRDRIAAMMALVSARRAEGHPNYTIATRRREAHAYRRPYCKGWHLTSEPKRRRSR